MGLLIFWKGRTSGRKESMGMKILQPVQDTTPERRGRLRPQSEGGGSGEKEREGEGGETAVTRLRGIYREMGFIRGECMREIPATVRANNETALNEACNCSGSLIFIDVGKLHRCPNWEMGSAVPRDR